MDHLDDITLDELRRALREIEGSTPAQRLTAAIAYKNGVSQTELAEWYGVERRTIYSWLKRLDDDESLVDAVSDEERSGRPRKLDDEQLQRLTETLHAPPTDAGYDATAWSPSLVQRHLEEAFDVNYSLPSCRRLMKEAGLSYQRPLRPEDDSDAGVDTGRWTH